MIHKRSPKFYQKTSTNSHQFQGSARIQKQLTKTMPFYKHPERDIVIISYNKIKYVGINLTQDVKDLYNENFKSLKKD